MIDEVYVSGVNARICAETGTESIVINPNGLSSAVGTMQWFDTVEEQASALFRSIILNHPFRDGNKRTATLCLILMREPSVSDGVLETIAIEVAKGNLTDPVEIAEMVYG